MVGVGLRTELTCRECGHSHTIGGTATGSHTDYCLHCETADPGFDRETVRA